MGLCYHNAMHMHFIELLGSLILQTINYVKFNVDQIVYTQIGIFRKRLYLFPISVKLI